MSKNIDILNKWNFYKKKYGFFHASFGYLGRYNLEAWKLVGSMVTRPYIQTWLKDTTNKYRILNLGGGGNCIDECLTVDIVPRADAYVDISKKLPFKNSSFDAIFCEEAIEHIPLLRAEGLLKECFRILRSGGVLRLSTPDLDYFAKKVLSSAYFCDEINEIFYEHGHCYLYTRQALHGRCLEAGFENIQLSSYQDPDSKLGYLDSHADRFNHPPEISQYLEMKKGAF
jgi:predicted SAM-dependent methyltransferase